MTTTSTCPDEPELLAVATGEPASEAIEQHVAACPACRRRVERLRAEVAELQLDPEGKVKSPSTEPDPTADPGGGPSGGGPTLSWQSGPAEDTAPGSIGPDTAATAPFGGSTQ